MSRAPLSYTVGLPQSGTDKTPPADPGTKALGIQNQALRYAGLSVLSFVGNLGLLLLLHEGLGLSNYIAIPIAMACMTTFNFFTIRLAIFRNATANWLKQFAGFLASIAGFRVVEYISFIVLHGVLAVPYLPAYASILIAVAVTKFLFLRNILFAAPRPAPPITEPTS